MLGITALQSTHATGVNITTAQTVATYANGAGSRKLRPALRLSALNGAAATIVVRIRNTTDGADVWATAITKGSATDTAIEPVLPSIMAVAGKSYALLIQSSNASDTNASWAVDWFDASHADVQAIDGDATAADNLAAIAHRYGLVIHVAHTGNDATSGAALKAAVEDASAGTTVFVGPGVFDIGNNVIEIPSGVSVCGSGAGVTVIASTATLASNAIINPGSGTVVSHLTIHATLTGQVQLPFGFFGGQHVATYAVLQDAEVIAESDGVFLSALSATGELHLRRVTFHSKFDTFVSEIDDGNYRVYATDCRFMVSGPATGSTTCRGIALLSGPVTFRGTRCIVEVTQSGTATETYGITVNDGRSTVEMVDSHVYTSASAGTVLDIRRLAGEVRVANTTYDPSKTSGTIVQIDTPGNVTGKVLGGGSATITGIGARVVDGSGNAIAPASDVADIKAKTDNLPDEPASKGDVQVTVQPTTLDSTAVDAIRDGLATSEQVSQITAKLPSSAYLAGSDSEDGAVATDASLTITPYQVNASNPRYSTRDLPPIAQGSEPTEVWTITDGKGAAVDLSGKTMRVVVCAVDKGELDANSQPFDDTLIGSFKYETGDGITIRGDDNNQVWLDHNASKTATPGVYRYFLWNVTDKLLLAKGRMPIEPAKMDLS